MVQTRQQAEAEAQAADPTLPALIVNLAPSIPASAPPKEGGAKKPGSKKVSPKKVTPRKPPPKSKSPKDKVKNRSTTSAKEDGSNDDDTGDGQFAKKTETPAIKQGRMKKTPEGIIEAPSSGNENEDVDTARPELARKDKAKPKATHTKRASGNDIAEDEDASGAGEPRTKKSTAGMPKKSAPRNVPTVSGTDPDKTETEEDLEQKMKAYEKRKRTQAAIKREAPITDAGEGPQSAEPPKKKTQRSAARKAATQENSSNDPNDKPQESMPSDGSSKRAAAATEKAVKEPKPHTEPVVGSRRSGRIRGNLVVASRGAEDEMMRRPLKVRFKKRAKTPETTNNKIGLDENEIFNPRFPIDIIKPAKATKRTRNGDPFSTKAKQRTFTREANRRTLTPWERTMIVRLTERLIVQEEPSSGAAPILVGEPLPVRFERRSLDSSGHGIVELGTQDSEAQMPTLINEIHPIWASRNFTFSKGPSEKHRAYNERAYKAISPALRLASHWIEEPEFEEFWHTLWVGSLSQNKKTGAVTIHARGPGGVYGETPFHELKIARSKEPAKEKAASLMQELAELESLEWRFESTRIKYVGLSATAGQISTLHDWFERDIFYDSKPPPNSTRTTSERLRVLFFLAVHLCRELVQQVYHHNWARDFEDTPPPRISKVLFETADDASDYLEVAWDTFMFTGSIVKMNPHKFTQVDCPDGLCTALGRRAAEWKGSASPKTFAAIPMRWVNDLFQDSFWSHKESSSYFPRLPDGDPPHCAAGPFA